MSRSPLIPPQILLSNRFRALTLRHLVLTRRFLSQVCPLVTCLNPFSSIDPPPSIHTTSLTCYSWTAVLFSDYIFRCYDGGGNPDFAPTWLAQCEVLGIDRRMEPGIYPDWVETTCFFSHNILCKALQRNLCCFKL